MNKYSALIMLVAGALAATAASADERSVERQVTADVNGEVSIDNVAGSIIVSAWDRPQVAVHAELGADALQLSVSSEPGHTHVRIDGYTDHPGNLVHLFAEVGGEAQLRVQVPRGSQLTVTGVSADIRSTGVAGAQHLQAVSGKIEADVFAAPVEVRTVNGDIRLLGDGHAGQINAASVSGSVHLGQGAGDVQARSISGNLQLAINPAGTVQLRTTSGNIRIDGALAPKAHLDMNTVSGHIDLQTAAPGGLTYDVNSFSGDIGDCFGQQAEHISRYGPGSRLAGTRGDGTASLRIRTLSGDVSLCDRAPQHP
jgi:DUF4097 and DUF4098 domain-containing protein YvlB